MPFCSSDVCSPDKLYSPAESALKTQQEACRDRGKGGGSILLRFVLKEGASGLTDQNSSLRKKANPRDPISSDVIVQQCGN